VNRASLNEMHARRRNHAMKLAPAQLTHRLDVGAHEDRIAAFERPFRGFQLAGALIDAAAEVASWDHVGTTARELAAMVMRVASNLRVQL